ncbi:multidrug efflux MFS transporter, partial [Mycobacterium tuberculosis]|uniref:multidrug efflux MFS transporter n=1 Tax=Mycobacterium tuberculosis TaxID=1773 RepID=UPI0013638F90
MRLRRRGLASINSEIRDGILPAAGDIAQVAREDNAVDHTPKNYRLVALIIACALFMEQMDATILATALPTMARDFHVPATNM